MLEFCGYLKPVEQKVDPKDYGTAHSELAISVGMPWLRMGANPQARCARPFTGVSKWAQSNIPGFSSVLTTGGGRVFNGDPTGTLRAFDAENGKMLWSFNAGSGMRSIVSYAMDGEQVHLGAKRLGLLCGNLAAVAVPQLEKNVSASTLIAFKSLKSVPPRYAAAVGYLVVVGLMLLPPYCGST
jgi:alcohol dehydrogenase (cytochrome c)